MKRVDPALNFAYPRFLAAIYFGLLSVVGTILINALLTSIGVEEVIPVFQAIILGMIVASCTGALFGERIIHSKKPFTRKTFWLGFSMVMASLPVFCLGLVFFMKEDNSVLFSVAKFHDLVLFYLVALAYSYILFGFILAIAAGLAAMYLRKRLVYDVMHTHERRRRVKHAPLKDKTEHKVRAVHR